MFLTPQQKALSPQEKRNLAELLIEEAYKEEMIQPQNISQDGAIIEFKDLQFYFVYKVQYAEGVVDGQPKIGALSTFSTIGRYNEIWSTWCTRLEKEDTPENRKLLFDYGRESRSVAIGKLDEVLEEVSDFALINAKASQPNYDPNSEDKYVRKLFKRRGAKPDAFWQQRLGIKYAGRGRGKNISDEKERESECAKRESAILNALAELGSDAKRADVAKYLKLEVKSQDYLKRERALTQALYRYLDDVGLKFEKLKIKAEAITLQTDTKKQN